MPWNDPGAIVSRRVIEVEKNKKAQKKKK